jgi:hypothetical protein
VRERGRAAAWALGMRVVVAGIRTSLEFFPFPRMHTNEHECGQLRWQEGERE